MRIIALILISLSTTFFAQEFVHKQKTKRVTLSTIKDEYGEIFSQQLRESALILQAIGRVQLLDLEQHFFSMQTMQDIVCKLHCYSVELSNLIGSFSLEQIKRPQSDSVKQILPELVIIIGSIQQHVIGHLQDLLEDTGTIFVRQHVLKLSDLVPKMKRYTQDLQTLHRLLISGERSAQKKETVIVKEKV
jgi:hypothetical protein